MHISSKLKRRRLMGGVAGLTLFVCTWTFLLDTFRLPIPLFDSPSPISCHYTTLDGEILNTENLDFSPPAVKSIFFHVTSCHANASIHLSPRQACAVESAAMMNPGYKVYVLFAGPVLANTSSNLTDQLLAYGNVEFNRVYLPAYARKTPVEALILNGKVVGSRYALYHTSDVLRYLTMWKFGGVYLDLDVVVVRSLEGLPGSFTGMEEPGVVAAGAMAFDNSFSGRFFAEKCMKIMSQCMTLVCLITLLCWSCQGSGNTSSSWEDLSNRLTPVWYDQDKLGILVAWGVFAVPAFKTGEFWERLDEGSKEHVQYMIDNFGPRYKYPDLATLLTGEFFNATYWADLFSKSGAKYVVMTSKYTDGFAMFPSNWSFNWNSVDVGPHVDVLGELSKAVRNKALKFGIHCGASDYRHPFYIDDTKNDYKTNNYVVKKLIPELKQQITDYEPYIIDMWNDTASDSSYYTTAEFLSWLYNESPVKDMVVANDFWGQNCHCKCGDYDHVKCEGNEGRKWHKEYPIHRYYFSYQRKTRNTDFYTINEILEYMIYTVASGGNLDLIVSPSETGAIPPLYEERLLQLGGWMKINGEGIYKTSPWVHHRDSYNKQVWYTCVKKPHAYDRKNPTRRGKSEDFSDIESLYALFVKWPEDNVLTLKDVFACMTCEKDTIVRLLGNEDIFLEWTVENSMISIRLPEFAVVKSTWAWVLRFQLQH